MKAFVFPGQGAQFVGMGKDLYDNNPLAKELFEKANDILGFRITDIMFSGTDEELKQTKVTQPAVFLHSVISALCMGENFTPDMVAGHSLGEFSALVAAGARIIGVNNRNLKDFTVDTANSRKLRDMIPDDIIFVSESGVKSTDDIRAIREIGADAVLIGETLMRADDKKAKLDELRLS